MPLKYRGISYDYQPPAVAMKPSNMVGQYRGLEWRFRRPSSVAVQQPTLNLVYRGVAYQTGPAPQVQPVPKPAAVEQLRAAAGTTVRSPVHQLARSLMTGHHNLVKQRQQSMLGRVAAQVGMGVDAAHYWGHIQGKVNSGFSRSYDRSHVAMS